MTVSLSLHITYGVLFSQPRSFLALLSTEFNSPAHSSYLCRLAYRNTSPHISTTLVLWYDYCSVESESESYITTVSQSASLSWNKAPIWGLRPDIYLSLTITALFLWSSSLTRGRVWRLCMLLALASEVFLGSESLWTRNHILLSRISDFPFRRLLRPAGSRWRYSTPPPYRVPLVVNCSFSIVISRRTEY
jgi:hypothetical protein